MPPTIRQMNAMNEANPIMDRLGHDPLPWRPDPKGTNDRIATCRICQWQTSVDPEGTRYGPLTVFTCSALQHTTRHN